MNVLRALALAIFGVQPIYVFAKTDEAKGVKRKRDVSPDAASKKAKSGLYSFSSNGALVCNTSACSQCKSKLNQMFSARALGDLSQENLPYALALVLTLEEFANGPDKEIAEAMAALGVLLSMLSVAQRENLEVTVQKNADLLLTSLVHGLSDIDLVWSKLRPVGSTEVAAAQYKLWVQYLRNWLRLQDEFGTAELARMHQASTAYTISTGTKLSAGQRGALEEYAAVQSEIERLWKGWLVEYPGGDVVLRATCRGVAQGFTRQDVAVVIGAVHESINKNAESESSKVAAMAFLGMLRRFSGEYFAQLDRLNVEIAAAKPQ